MVASLLRSGFRIFPVTKVRRKTETNLKQPSRERFFCKKRTAALQAAVFLSFRSPMLGGNPRLCAEAEETI